MNSEQLETSSKARGTLLSIPQDNLIPNYYTEENPLRTDRVSYLSNLTPLRGIAALLTVIFHINIVFGYEMTPAPGSPVMTHMYLMVDFFFYSEWFYYVPCLWKSFREPGKESRI